MAEQALIFSVRLLDGRYHGAGDWPPSPFRLFQALVAAAHLGREATEAETAALRWLEHLAPPIIAAPKAQPAGTTAYWVPRNGADAFGGNLARAAQARDAKYSKPQLFDARVPLLYVWRFADDGGHAAALVRLADLLYQLGRGVDMAFALAETCEAAEAERRLALHPGSVHRPTPQGSRYALRCPQPGASLDSLRRHHAEQLSRLRGGYFRQAAPPTFQTLGYDAPPLRFLYELRPGDTGAGFAALPLTHAVRLAEAVRDHIAERLRPHHPGQVERYLMGREAGEADKALRVRIVPLPSIGHAHTPEGIRRVLVEVPPDCPVPAADIDWACAGAALPEAGGVLVPTKDGGMLDHYGIGGGPARWARVWRTVTPVALPVHRSRGARGGGRRADSEDDIAHAARQALRHAGWDARADVRRIQRELFEAKGTRAEGFAHGRFAAAQLYHLEIAFEQPVAGPVLVGNGRYLGLGLLRPVAAVGRDLFALPLLPENRPRSAERAAFLEAVRRALMSLARDADGSVGRLFSGHEPDGSAARSGRHEHVFLAAEDRDGDGLIDRLWIVAPWRADRRAKAGRLARDGFERVASTLARVRAGRLGVIEFAGFEGLDGQEPLVRCSQRWASVTAFVPTRFPKPGEDACAAVAADLALECLRRGLPRPAVQVKALEAGPRGGVRAYAQLDFAVAVSGPLLLGRDSHSGGGLFRAE
jgi:CRISPR-associated protein Csb2